MRARWHRNLRQLHLFVLRESNRCAVIPQTAFTCSSRSWSRSCKLLEADGWQLGYSCEMILNAVIERDLQTGLLVGSVPGVPGAHTQGETVEEVRQNLAEVIALLREEGALQPESEFIATTSLAVG